jgi:hypothetical protein
VWERIRDRGAALLGELEDDGIDGETFVAAAPNGIKPAQQ